MLDRISWLHDYIYIEILLCLLYEDLPQCGVQILDSVLCLMRDLLWDAGAPSKE